MPTHPQAGIVSTLCGLLQAPQAGALSAPCMLLVLTGIQDALKKGQQLLKWSVEMAVVDGSTPLSANPIGAQYKEDGTMQRLQVCMHACTRGCMQACMLGAAYACVGGW